MTRRLLTASAIAVVVAAAFLAGSGRGSTAAMVRGARQVPAGLAEAIHARFGAGPIAFAAERAGNPELGYRLVVSADGTTALVSAPGLSNARGAVYVYHVSSPGSWASTSTPTATLKVKGAKVDSLFGHGVALSADGTTAFIGAPLANREVGAVYVFHVSSENAWLSTSTPTATLRVSKGYLQGSSVATSADGTTIVTGAPFYNTFAGGAFVYHVASEDAWVSTSTPAAILTNAGESGSDLGVAGVVAMSGDGTTALLSDTGADSYAGAAYVFNVASEAAWASSSTPTAILSDANGFADDQLTGSVALSGDGTTAFLGAPGAQGGAGSVDVFQASGESAWATTSTPTATLTDAAAPPNDFLGGFVRVSTDGTTVVATGIPPKGIGALQVFHVTDEGSWATTDTPTASLTDSARVRKDALGVGLSISGDGATVVTGAPGFNWATGSADVFHASDESSWLTTSKPTARLTNSALPHPECVVPRLVGLPLDYAKFVLEGSSCRLGEVKRVHNGRKWRGRVVAQSPARGKHLRPGAPVRVQVGK